MIKNPPVDAGDKIDVGLIPGSGRSSGRGHGNPLQYSCLGNSMDRGAWQAIVHGVAQSQTRLKRLSMNTQELFSLCVFTSLPAKQGVCQIFIY